MASFWRFLLLVVVAPFFGIFAATLLTWAWGISFQSDYGAVAWSIYAGFIGIFSFIIWRLAKPRETWDKSVSPLRQQEATDWFIREVKKDENEK